MAARRWRVTTCRSVEKELTKERERERKRGNCISGDSLQQLQSDKAFEDTIEVPIVRDFERRRKEGSLGRHALTLTFTKREREREDEDKVTARVSLLT